MLSTPPTSPMAAEAQSLSDLRGLVLVWPPIEQFLILSGRTYFKDMAFDDLERMQFDLETTGLDDERDRIFMISMRDSRGWRACLESSTLGETSVAASASSSWCRRAIPTCSRTTTSSAST